MTIEPIPLGDLVAVDFDADRTPVPCSYCPNWRFEFVDAPEGESSMLREWHLADCPNVAGTNQ
jgi:hypothetical protein